MMNHTKFRHIIQKCILTITDDGTGNIEAVVTIKKDNTSFVEYGRNLTELLNNIDKQLKKL